MNISADGILGSAQKISQKRISARKDAGVGKNQSKSDNIEIGLQLKGRLNTMQGDLKSAQDSLSKNQVIGDGLARIYENLNNGESGVKAILDETTYNGQSVLAEYLEGNTITEEYLRERMADNRKAIVSDTDNILKLQVESENIFASSLVGEPDFNYENMISAQTDTSQLSQLNADVVMRLTK